MGCGTRVVLGMALGVILLVTGNAAASPEPIEAAIRDLDRDHDHATAAVYELQAGGAAAAEAVQEAWPSLSLLARKRVIRALQSLGQEHDAAMSVLLMAARADDAELRELGLDALRRGGAHGLEGLVTLVGDARVGDRAASLLARSDPDFAVSRLLEAMTADGGPSRPGLRKALAVAVLRARRPRPKLEQWLATAPAPDAMASAAEALSGLKGYRDIVTSWVEQALLDSHDFVTSWRLLRTAGTAGPSNAIDRWVKRQLTEPSEWMLRAEAVDAITSRGKREQARRSLSDPYPRVRSRAAEALTGDPGSLLTRATLARRDPWPMVRASAVRSLRGEADAVPVIVAAVDDSMSTVREAAIDVLARAPGARGWDRVHRRLRKADEWPGVIAAAIGYVVAHCRADAAESLFGVVVRATPSTALTEDLNNAALAIEALRALRTAESKAVIIRLRSTPGVPPTLKIALERPLEPHTVCIAPGT